MSRGQGLLVVLSGPSGAGKSSVLRRLKRHRGHWPLHVAVTATTRPRRRGERQGVPYHFWTTEEFERHEERGQLLEQAVVYGYRYGVPQEEVERPLAQGATVVVQTDVQGAATLRGRYPEVTLIFLAPPSLEELEHRLRERQMDSEESLQRRLAIAEREMADASWFDYRVVNETGRLTRAVAQVWAILVAERCRVRRGSPWAAG